MSGAAAHRLRDDEDGRILLLALGYALLALAVIVVAANALTLYLAQQRADTVADAAALAAADGFDIVVGPAGADARLDAAEVARLAAEVVAASSDASLVAATTADGVSARVTVATVWQPPIVSVFVPDGVRLTATATTRVALR